MKRKLAIFRTYSDPLEAEELIEILQNNSVLFERRFEKSSNLDDYIGSHPFDADIVISIPKADFSTVEAFLQSKTD